MVNFSDQKPHLISHLAPDHHCSLSVIKIERVSPIIHISSPTIRDFRRQNIQGYTYLVSKSNPDVFGFEFTLPTTYSFAVFCVDYDK